ncbi:MAG: phosphoribosyltransferase family protein [Mycobacteriales bacterium]
MRYANRAAAGRALANRLTHLSGHPDTIVLGLPRGGVPVAAEIATALRLPLDALVVRKLGVPDQPELAMGAIAPHGVRVLHDSIVRRARVSPADLDRIAGREEREVDRQESLYRGGKPPLDLTDRTAVLVDDGLATGASMLAAIRAARAMGAARVIAAAPVGALDTVRRLESEADEVVVDHASTRFGSVGQWYDDFRQVPDAAVLDALKGGGTG